MTECMQEEIAAVDDILRALRYTARQLDHMIEAKASERTTLAYRFKKGHCQCADCVTKRVFNKLEG